MNIFYLVITLFYCAKVNKKIKYNSKMRKKFTFLVKKVV